jgi:hypothetical protein
MLETGLLKVLTDIVRWLSDKPIPGLLAYLRRPRLSLALFNTDPEGFARGEWTPYGEGGPRAYFYHLIVRNEGSEPAKEVWVELTSLHKPSEADNTLSRRLHLRKADDDQEQPSSGSIRGHGEATWNLGFLAHPTHLKHFQLDVYRREWPLNFQGVVGKRESLRVEVQAVAANARTELLGIDIRWDGKWIEDDPENMKQHIQVRELRR